MNNAIRCLIPERPLKHVPIVSILFKNKREQGSLIQGMAVCTRVQTIIVLIVPLTNCRLDL